MRLHGPRRFLESKSGNRPEECEDVSRISYPAGDGPARIVLCDGASESAFAREWAEILTRSFVRRPLDLSGLDSPSLFGWLGSCGEEWDGVVPWDRIPWHGEAKTNAGAFATLLGMAITPTHNGTGAVEWQAVAIGDSCLFIVRDDALLLSFPLDSPAQFDNTPHLLCSNPKNNGGLWERVRQLEGICLPGDLIMLASDALACWMLQQCDSGDKPWEAFEDMRTDGEWARWVQARRDERTMSNDDTTLIAVKVR